MVSISQVYQIVLKHMKVRKNVIFLHFLLQYILAAITITLFFLFDNVEWAWAYLALPCMIVYQVLWYMSRKLLFTHENEGCYNITFFVINLTLFCVGYYVFFHPMISPEYSKGSNCTQIHHQQFNTTGAKTQELYTLRAIQFQDDDNNLKIGCACTSTTYNKNVLFNEPTPNVYYKFGDEIGKKEVKYNSTQVKIASWKCGEPTLDITQLSQCHYRYNGEARKAKDKIQEIMDNPRKSDKIFEDACKNAEDFIEVLYVEPPGYYSPAFFFMLFAVPFNAFWSLSFNQILVYISHKLIQGCSKQQDALFSIKSLKLKRKKKQKGLSQSKDKLLATSSSSGRFQTINNNKKSQQDQVAKEKKNQVVPSFGAPSPVKPVKKLEPIKMESKKKDNKANKDFHDILAGGASSKMHSNAKHSQQIQQELDIVYQYSSKVKLEQQFFRDQEELKKQQKKNKNKNNNTNTKGDNNNTIQDDTAEDKDSIALRDEQNNIHLQNIPDKAKVKSSNFKLMPVQGQKRRRSLDNNNNQYNPDTMPAKYKTAEEHSRAWIVGEEEQQFDDENPGLLCQCCSRQVLRVQMPLDCELTELSFLGCGYPQYFYFIKFALYILIVIFSISGIYGLVTNMQGNDCLSSSELSKLSENDKSLACHQSFITIPSLGNKRYDIAEMDGQQVVNLVTIFIVIIGLHIFRRQMRIVEKECDNNDINASDYTIMISNMPYQFNATDYDDEIRKFFEVTVSRIIYKNEVGKKLKVQSVNLCYDTQRQFQLESKKKALIEKKKSVLRHYVDNLEWKDSVDEYIDYDNEIQNIENELEVLEDKFKGGKSWDIHDKFAGYAFVSFRTEQEVNEIIRYFGDGDQWWCSKARKRLLFHGNKIKIETAPDATNVFWEYMHVRPNERWMRSICGNSVIIFTLIFCLGTIALLKVLQSEFTTDEDEPSSTDKMIAQVFAISVSVGIFLLNYFLVWVIKFVELKKAYTTRTMFNIGVAKTLTIAQFFNTGVLTLIVDVLVPVLIRDKEEYPLIYRTGGLVYNIFYVFITNAFVTPIVSYFDPPFLVKKLTRFKVEKEEKMGKPHVYSQQQLQTAFENPHPDMATQYAVLIKTLFFTMLYAVIIPFGMVITIAGLVILYFVDKKNILRHRTIKYTLSTKLCIEMTEMIEYMLPIYAASNWLFFSFTSGEDAPVTCIIGLIVSVVNFALPMQDINEYLFDIPQGEPNTLTYDQALYQFDTDYARENPATSEYAREQHLLAMSKRKRR